MARRARAYRGAKRQKEKVRQTRQQEKRRRRQDKKQSPHLLENQEPGPESLPPDSPDQPPDT
ncbi:MAG: hypothetical protein ACE10F_10725 [Candidatus Methylomirabilales bacterium]|nr:hypothetical protein [candidate division NC10 bacterium]